MYNINVSLNKTLMQSMKAKLKQAGYSNISEYIRDLLRHDLKLAHCDQESYSYDHAYINKLGQEALENYKKGNYKELKSIDDLLE